MLICRVTGVAVSTVKDESLKGAKLLVVEELSRSTGEPRPFVAIDTVGAGKDEVVIVAMGSAARETPRTRGLSVDAAVVGIVDSMGTADIAAAPPETARPARMP